MYVLLGSNGNITSKAARLLLAQGKPVRVIGRSAQNLAPLKAAGVDTVAGEIGDERFLTGALAGATAVYAMIPPDYSAADMLVEQDRAGTAITRALVGARVPRVVNLSSIGAHLTAGTGPIVGLYRQEQRLNALAGIDLLHLRPGGFFENHLSAIGTVQALGVYADMTASNVPIPMIATADIAAVVARELVAAGAGGKRVLHLHARRFYSMADCAAVLGAAIGKPDLKHVKADPAQAKAAMIQHGFSANAAQLFEELSAAFSAGSLNGQLAAGPTEITPTPLEQFAEAVFKPAFEGARRAA